MVWESFGWDVLAGEPQRVLAARYDAGSGSWSLPQTISDENATFWNQTPRIAADPRGGLWTVWSGRTDPSSPCSIYLSHLDGEAWSMPTRLSRDGETARAPAIVVDADGDPWIAWHSGIGAEMRVVVLHHRPHPG